MGPPVHLDEVDKSLPYAEPIEVGPVVSLDVVKSAKFSVSARDRTPTSDVSVRSLPHQLRTSVSVMVVGVAMTLTFD